MIPHQKLIRERLRDDHPVPEDFSGAEVREISLSLAKTIILKYEYLGNMGSARRAFGLFFDGELAGAECFGATGGTNTAQSICGAEYADRVFTLVRGACVSWGHSNSASYLITRACKLMALEGKNVFVAYADPDAGERGFIYRLLSWHYCGTTGAGRMFRTPSGRVLDERNISNYARDRRGGVAAFCPKPARSEVKARMVREGYSFHERTPKHRFVGIYGDRRIRKQLISALRWDVLPYPLQVARVSVIM